MNVPTTAKQREVCRPHYVRDLLEQVHGGPLPEGTRYTGTQIENFREGWAKAIGSRGRAHYFKRTSFEFVESLCGVVKPVRLMFGKGNHDDCERCVLKKAARVY